MRILDIFSFPRSKHILSKSHDARKVKMMVKEILINNEEARDDDNVLLILFLELYAPGVSSLQAADFFKELREGYFPSFESISRARRILQEKNESLRGKRWIARQNIAKRFRQKLSMEY